MPQVVENMANLSQDDQDELKAQLRSILTKITKIQADAVEYE